MGRCRRVSDLLHCLRQAAAAELWTHAMCPVYRKTCEFYSRLNSEFIYLLRLTKRKVSLLPTAVSPLQITLPLPLFRMASTELLYDSLKSNIFYCSITVLKHQTSNSSKFRQSILVIKDTFVGWSLWEDATESTSSARNAAS